MPPTCANGDVAGSQWRETNGNVSLGAGVLDDLPRNYFGAILADPPWPFRTWSSRGRDRSVDRHYREMSIEDIKALPIANAAMDHSVLFLWVTNPQLPIGLEIICAWGFAYKTIAFVWTKEPGPFGLGYWTRANSEICLLATRGKPKRINADVRQTIIEPRREHSRKPDCVYNRIERLVAGPYLELFARNRREGWTSWGNEVDKYNAIDDFSRSIEDCYAAVRERKAQGGKGWGD